jgi:hypothetical protein
MSELNSSNHCSLMADGKVKPKPEDLPDSINNHSKLSGERLKIKELKVLLFSSRVWYKHQA